MKILVVCAQRYNGHELWTALGVLQNAGHTFEVISTATIIADEVTGQANVIERTLDDVEPEELTQFDGIMFVSGNMADTEAYWHMDRPLQYVRKAHELDLPIAAICCSVPTIRDAAKNKRVSFYPLIRSRELLRNAGAILSNISISADGKLVTAEHQMASERWAEVFVDVLEGRDPDLNLVDSGFVPRGHTERRLHPTLERIRHQNEDS